MFTISNFTGNIHKVFYQNRIIGYVVVYKWMAYCLTKYLDLFQFNYMTTAENLIITHYVHPQDLSPLISFKYETNLALGVTTAKW